MPIEAVSTGLAGRGEVEDAHPRREKMGEHVEFRKIGKRNQFR